MRDGLGWLGGQRVNFVLEIGDIRSIAMPQDRLLWRLSGRAGAINGDAL
jgi:hypothetical protein